MARKITVEVLLQQLSKFKNTKDIPVIAFSDMLVDVYENIHGPLVRTKLKDEVVKIDLKLLTDTKSMLLEAAKLKEFEDQSLLDIVDEMVRILDKQTKKEQVLQP